MISSTPQTDTVHVIGGGLAGSEAAWQVANAGVRVVLHEMRPVRMTEAHRTEGLAELVCSNSFRSDDAANNAVGLLHAEMRRLGSLIMRCADANQVPAGGALAVDRDGFSAAVTRALHDHPLIEIDRAEIAGLPAAEWGNAIVATGPLTSAPLADAIRELTDENALAFFDAIAPIVHKDSIDMSVAWFQSRYDKVGPGGTGADYINCPMTKEQYDAFVAALLAGEKVDFKDWETNTPYFDGCLRSRYGRSGPETLRPGDEARRVTNRQPHRKARIVQLRRTTSSAPLQNRRFQTKMTMARSSACSAPFLTRERQFARLAAAPNTFRNSQSCSRELLAYAAAAAFDGQMAGCEGYVESPGTPVAGSCRANARRSRSTPRTTAGVLLGHTRRPRNIEAGKRSFHPMNINFVVPPAGSPRQEPDGTSCAATRNGGKKRRRQRSRLAVIIAGSRITCAKRRRRNPWLAQRTPRYCLLDGRRCALKRDVFSTVSGPLSRGCRRG